MIVPDSLTHGRRTRIMIRTDSDSEILERIRNRVLPPLVTSWEAFRWVDESTPVGVVEAIRKLLKAQDALLGYVQLADIQEDDSGN